MTKFQPDLERLEPRQLLAADWGAVELLLQDETAEAYAFELRSRFASMDEDVGAEAADRLAEQLLADDSAWEVESQVQTDEELAFASGESFGPDAVDVHWLVG